MEHTDTHACHDARGSLGRRSGTVGLVLLLVGFAMPALGWLVPTEKVLFCTLSPKHRQAEMMGVLLCVHMSFSWLPPLLFSIINEAGYSLRWALASDNLLLLIALFISWYIGDYKRAVEQANRGVRG